jgi:hypothetical protein
VRGGRPRRRAITPAAPSLSFPQAQDGSAKQRLLFEMIRARVAVNAAVQGLEPASGEEPTGAGDWTVRRHVLHLIAWDRAVARALESALLGAPPPWAGFARAQVEAFHAPAVEELSRLDWNEALRRLFFERDQLMDALESVPELPAESWAPDHPFGAMVADLASNDRHHAEIIKHWRSSRG